MKNKKLSKKKKKFSYKRVITIREVLDISKLIYSIFTKIVFERNRYLISYLIQMNKLFDLKIQISKLFEYICG